MEGLSSVGFQEGWAEIVLKLREGALTELARSALDCSDPIGALFGPTPSGH